MGRALPAPLVELICATVPIAPPTYFLHKAQHADPSRRRAHIV